MFGFYNQEKLNDEGASLVELLIAIFLSTIVCLSLAKLLQGSLKMRQVVQIHYKDNLVSLQVAQRLQGVLDDLDAHPLYILPRVHKAGEITFIDGTELSIKNKNNRPSKNSDAVTALSLSLEYMYDVQEQHGMSFYACPRFKRSRSDEHSFGYVGLGVDGMWELQGNSFSHFGGKGCMNFSLTVPKSMLIEPPEQNEKIIRILIPIKSYYTLYVDNNQQLRYLSHRGEIIVENQPLYKNIQSLSLNKKLLWDSIFCLSAEMECSDERIKNFRGCNRLGRYEYLNFIMNR